MPIISVVIPTYNDPLRLQWVLAGLAHQEFADFEVIVVSDGGKIPKGYRRVWIREQPLMMFHLPESDDAFRVGQARNWGAQHASGDLLLFLDQDCVPPTHLLEAHAEAYSRYGESFVGAGRRYNVPESAVAPLSPSCDFNAEFGRLRAIAEPDGHEDVDESFRILIWGCHLSLTTDVFLQMGGFDNRFVGWGGEDQDLLLRILSSNLHAVNMGLRNAVLHLNHPLRNSTQNDELMRSLRDTGLVRNGGPLKRLVEPPLPTIDELIKENEASGQLSAADYAIRVGGVV